MPIVTGKEYTAVLWVSAESQETLRNGMLLLAQELGLPERDAQEQDRIVTVIRRWLETHSDWMLILDNVEDMALAHSALPTLGQGHALATTRSQAIGQLGAHWRWTCSCRRKARCCCAWASTSEPLPRGPHARDWK